MKLLNPQLLLIAFLLPLQALLAQEEYRFKETVQTSGMKRGKVVLEMPAGVLNIKAQSNALAEANILYGRADWKPQSTQTTYNQTTELRLKQPELRNNNSKKTEKNNWDINLSKNIPLDLMVELGAGESKMDLRNSKVEKVTMSTGAGSLNIDLRNSQVRDLKISSGVGEVVLDLRGNWDHDVQVDVSGGIGDVKLLLSKNTGVRLKSSGLSSVSAGGLKKEGNNYSNQALGKSKHTISINVSSGLGSVSVTQEN